MRHGAAARAGWTVVAAGLLTALCGCEEWLVPSSHFNDGRPTALNPGVPNNFSRRMTDIGGPDLWVADAGADAGAPSPKTFQAALALGNQSDQTVVVRARTLRDGLQVDCKAIAKFPHEALSEPAFGPSHTWVIPPGQAVPIDAPEVKGGSCRAVLLESSAVGSRLVFWDAAAFPAVALSVQADKVAEDRLVRLTSQEGQLTFAWHAALYPAPVTPGPAAPPCDLPAAASSIAWSQPAPAGAQTVMDVQQAPDGCLAVQFKGAPGLAKWFVCLPAGAFPFGVGSTLTAKTLTHGHMGLGQIAGLELAEPAGGKVLRMGVGMSAVPHGDMGPPAVAPQPGCPGQHDSCGDLAVPLTMTVQGEGNVPKLMLAGDKVTLANGGSLWLVNARDLRVLDPACSPAVPPFMRRLETVYLGAP